MNISFLSFKFLYRSCSKQKQAGQTRELEEFWLRAMSDDDDESGAIDLQSIIHGAEVLGPPLFNGVKQLWDEQ